VLGRRAFGLELAPLSRDEALAFGGRRIGRRDNLANRRCMTDLIGERRFIAAQP